jgi:hypothetical protein
MSTARFWIDRRIFFPQGFGSLAGDKPKIARAQRRTVSGAGVDFVCTGIGLVPDAEVRIRDSRHDLDFHGLLSASKAPMQV